jgi:hypothetical protein
MDGSASWRPVHYLRDHRLAHSFLVAGFVARLSAFVLVRFILLLPSPRHGLGLFQFSPALVPLDHLHHRRHRGFRFFGMRFSCVQPVMSNHAMERTADRCTTRLKEELRVMKQATLALIRRRSSRSR